MNITLLGASGGEVTGSCYVLRTKRANVMIDCGLFQGAHKLENHNRLPSKGALTKLDAVVLTHAHLDHTGRLPLLTRFGYRGPIYATPATISLTDLILRDSAHLQSEDVKRENRRRAEKGRPPVEALYTTRQVEQLRPLFKKMKYDQAQEVAPGVIVRVIESGHILGAVSLEVTVEENGTKKVIVFSGDLGPRGAPLHRDPIPFKHADVVFMESTYGDRDHRSLAETAIEAREAIRKTVEAKGRVLVPTFAIGRTQLLLYLLAGAFKRKTLTPFPIFIDSPMAIEATTIYRTHRELFDEEALAMAKAGELMNQLRTAKMLPKASDSRALATRPGPFLVMAGAGMCTGGRILHHLVNHLSDPTTLLLMVGYQSRGSVGRQIVEGARSVRIMGKTVAVRASTHTVGGLSGHAGQKDLLAWIGSMASSKPRVLLTHGEDGPRGALRGLIQKRYGITSEIPDYQQTIEL
ncbi:MAG: MBL fold metallo-hydrolase [Phycisphaerales bacterium]|nr:MBL fold metallo-hydrolase [Phycisphaerales bacterium]